MTETAATKWPNFLMDNYGTPALEFVSGQGSTLVDAAGKSYLDLLAGIAVNSLGYQHPEFIAAVEAQIRKVQHVSNYFATAPTVQLAEQLCARFGGGDDVRVMFCNSGTEANEAAFKLARLTGKSRVLAATHGFHGRTMGSLALTAQPDKQQGFTPMVQGVEYYPYGDLDYVTKLVEINPDDVAAIFLEPVQGETGVIPAPAGFLTGLRKLCDQYDILLVVDEVQAGVGRTGTFFAFEEELGLGAARPDIVTMAKGLAGGLPIGAVVARGKAASLFTPGKHGTTFGGNPVACAAGLAVLKVVDDDLLQRIRTVGAQFAEQLAQLPGVAEVRGRGLMLGVVLQEPCAKEIVKLGYEHGVIVNACNAQVVRIVPPLVITDEELQEALRRLQELFTLKFAQKA